MKSIITIEDYWRPYADALRRIYVEVRRSTFTWVDAKEFKWEDFDEQTEGEEIMIAKVNDNVVGFISLWMDDNFIHHLYIDELFRRQGVGKTLLHAAYKRIQGPIRLKCLVNNEAAKRFYLSENFVEVGTGESAHGKYILFERAVNI